MNVMDQQNRVNKQIEEILNSVDGIVPADPGPFFYTRVVARLESREKNSWMRISAFLTRPSVAIASIVILVAVNLSVILNFQNDTPDLSDNSVAEVYQAPTPIYDPELIDP
jgi:hypothetical protein